MKNYKILIVDDNEAIHDDFRKILGGDAADADFSAIEDAFFGTRASASPRLPFTMDFASQGRDAHALVSRAALAEEPYALVFIDVRMPPGWDGIETTARLWQLDPNLQVVICTAYSDYSWEMIMERLGPSDRMLILKKPFDISEVSQLAHMLTTKWTLQQENRHHFESLESAVQARTKELEQEVVSRKRSEEALMFTQFSVDNASDATSWIAPDSQLIYVNDSTCQSLGYAAGELCAMRIQDIVPQLGESGWPEFWNSLRIEQRRTIEAHHLTKEGRTIPIELTLNFFDFNGREFICASARDITVRKTMLFELSAARDAALEAVRLKGQFLANMSHEIRTPMNGVLGMSELLLHTNLNREQREYVDIVRSSARHLLEIINDILDFSKSDAGSVNLELEDFDLATLIEESLDVVSPLALKKGLEVAGAVSPGVPCLLRGDCGRLKQVLTNLLGNAVKFTESGEVTLEVLKGAGFPLRNVLEFEIRDTGIGIDPAFQGKIFEPFLQADGSATRKYGGTGLGLAICKQIIESMGGRLGVESRPGVGSRFWFTLEFESVGERPPLAAGPFRGNGRRALVVDDNGTNRRILRLQLSNLQMDCETAVGGQEALEILRAAAAAGRPFPVAIVDMKMPVMDGLALSRAIRAEPSLSGTRIIILSSLGDQVRPEILEAAGVQDYLVKPVKQSRLQLSLAGVLGLEPRALADFSNHAASADAPHQNTRILLAEDDSVNQKVALLQLRRLGYHADSVTDGAQVLVALQGAKYDVILMDCQMPVMDGYAATREIRAITPKLPVRIIAMTANAMPGDREKCLESGMDDHLSKPVAIGELERMLTRWGPLAKDGAILAADERPAVDLSRLLRITGNEPGMFREITSEYLEQADEILGLMMLALERLDLEELQRLAHKLGGSSSCCGMTAIVPSLAKIERMRGDFQPVLASDLIRLASQELKTIRRFIATYAETPEPPN